MGLRSVLRHVLVQITISGAAFLLLVGCTKGPYRFSDIDTFVNNVNVNSLGEVVVDEESGSEIALDTPPARDLEILVGGTKQDVARDVDAALNQAGCVRQPSVGCNVSSVNGVLHVAAVYVPAGGQLPSGLTIPPDSTGVVLGMTY